ncbi:MAG: hypothetical protein WB801_11010 [Candidatus Dormiibacterota bacterium]
MASDYLATQVAIVERLLGELAPERRAVLARAMKELAMAMERTSIPSGTSVDNVLRPDPQRWGLN